MSAFGNVAATGRSCAWEGGNLPGETLWFFVFPHRPAFRGGGAGRWGNTKNHGNHGPLRGDKTKGASMARPSKRKNHQNRVHFSWGIPYLQTLATLILMGYHL